MKQEEVEHCWDEWSIPAHENGGEKRVEMRPGAKVFQRGVFPGKEELAAEVWEGWENSTIPCDISKRNVFKLPRCSLVNIRFIWIPIFWSLLLTLPLTPQRDGLAVSVILGWSMG